MDFRHYEFDIRKTGADLNRVGNSAFQRKEENHRHNCNLIDTLSPQRHKPLKMFYPSNIVGLSYKHKEGLTEVVTCMFFSI